jgi:hypothetical protein
MLHQFTRDNRAILGFAYQEAADLGHTTLGNDHLILGILCNARIPAFNTLGEQGLTLAQAREVVRNYHQANDVESDPDKDCIDEDRDALAAPSETTSPTTGASAAAAGDDQVDRIDPSVQNVDRMVRTDVVTAARVAVEVTAGHGSAPKGMSPGCAQTARAVRPENAARGRAVQEKVAGADEDHADAAVDHSSRKTRKQRSRTRLSWPRKRAATSRPRTCCSASSPPVTLLPGL